MRYCIQCGAPLEENTQFCSACGARQPAPEQPAAPLQQANRPAPPPAAPAGAPFAKEQPAREQTWNSPPMPPAAYPAPAAKPKRHGKALLFSLLAVVLAAAGVGAYLLFFNAPATLPDITYSYLRAEEQIELDYKATDTIYPTLYGTMDSIINFTATCEGGEANVLVRVEIPGFTQPYEQLFTLSEQITQIYVRPPMLTGELSLDSQKEAQIVFTVTDQDTGKYVLQETVPISIKSKYDFQLWDDEFGVCTYDNLLAWLTPESDGVLELQREAIDWLEYLTDSYMNAFAGYQNIGGFDDDSLFLNTYYQALALQGAMGGEAGIRYNNTSFSTAGTDIQRIKLPDDVMESQSGICIETSLLMASALQAAGMHAMIILPPGHAQVAVETWENSGEYLLIETTYLPLDVYNADYAVLYFSNDEWDAYIQDPYGYGPEYGCYVLDCNLATTFGIVSISN